MRFSRTNMRLAAARLPDLSREIDAQAAEFSTTHFCPRNPGLTKSTTYARETAKIGRSLFKSSLDGVRVDLGGEPDRLLDRLPDLAGQAEDERAMDRDPELV